MRRMHARHVHRADRISISQYIAPVTELGQNPAAWFGVEEIVTCRCGALRRRNVNGLAVESSGWLVPERRPMRRVTHR